MLFTGFPHQDSEATGRTIDNNTEQGAEGGNEDTDTVERKRRRVLLHDDLCSENFCEN